MIHAIVTGSSGFIGSALVDRLLSMESMVDAVDSRYVRRPKHDKYFVFHHRVQDGLPLCTPDSVIFHLAATTSVPYSIENPDETLQNNHDSFFDVLKIAEKTKCRLIYASSSSVYGMKSPYAISKYTNEIYAKTYYENYGTRVIGLRFFNVFGPNQPKRAVIPLWIDSIQMRKEIKIYGDGKISRDFTYIDNVISALILASRSDAFGKVFDIGCGRSHTLIDLANQLRSYSDFNVLHGEPRQGDLEHSCADISDAKKYLGYDPKIDFKGGLDRLCQMEFKNLKRGSLD